MNPMSANGQMAEADRRNTMAKDPTQGTVSQYDSEGFPVNPTRSEVINAFGEELGGRLVKAGFSSMTSISVAVDMVFHDLGFSDEEIEVLREKAPFTGAPTQEEVEKVSAEVGEGDEAEEEEADEPEAEEADEPEADKADEPIPAIEMDVSILDPETTKANLLDMKLADLREICDRDDIQAARSKAETVERIMDAWFPIVEEAPAAVEEEEPPMSVRIRRIRQASKNQ
jgi:hypothetical protein